MLKIQYVSRCSLYLSLSNLDSSAGELFNIVNKRAMTHPARCPYLFNVDAMSFGCFMPTKAQSSLALLSDCFKQHNCDCGRKVQAARPVHWDGEAIVGIFRQ